MDVATINHPSNVQPLQFLSQIPKNSPKGFSVLMGHSLGEYNALVSGNHLTFEEGIALLSLRGKLMSLFLECSTKQFAMIAIKTKKGDELEFIIGKEKDFVIACFNSREEYVLSGLKSSILLFISRNATLINCSIELPSKIPFHSPWLEELSVVFRKKSIPIAPKKIVLPVVSNTTSITHDSSADLIDLLARHIYSPVLWKQSILYAKSNFVITEVVPFGSLMKNLYNSQ